MPDVVPSHALSGSTRVDLGRFQAQLTTALRDAHLPSVLAAVVQLTGDFSILEGEFRPHRGRGPGDHDDGGLPAASQAALRAEAVRVVMAHRSGQLRPVPPLTPQQVLHVLQTCLGEGIPEDEAGLLAEELGVVARRPAPFARGVAHAPRVLVIGTGFSGLCAAIRLQEAGISCTVVEKDADIGGTWFENTYPGCGVDTPVHLYSFSFAQRSTWPRYFAKQAEVRDYLADVTESAGLRDHIRFETEAESAEWSDADQQWTVRLRLPDGSAEAVDCDVVISAVGLLNRAAHPIVPGLGDFPGPVQHTSAWPAGTEFAGKRVAVIGSGASAMQLVPAIVEEAAHVTVFQRSPQWIIPNPNTNREVSESKRFLMAEFPGYLGWYRLRQSWNFGDRLHPMLRVDRDWPHLDRSINADNERHRVFLTSYIEEQLEGRPDLIEKSVPSYPPYGKRPLLDHGWFSALKRDNVTLIADGAERVEGRTVVAANGESAEVDLVVLATGFQTLNMLGPMDIRGSSGVALRDAWGPDDARALLGMTVPDFPNFFILFGPNTNAGHGGSHVLSVEIQVCYILQLLERMVTDRLSSVECRREPYEEYNRELDAALADSIWSHDGMTTYYRNAKGRIVTNVPWTNAEYWHRARTPRVDDFVLRSTAPPTD